MAQTHELGDVAAPVPYVTFEQSLTHSPLLENINPTKHSQVVAFILRPVENSKEAQSTRTGAGMVMAKS